MKKKLFVFDVDGTLLDHKNKEIPKSALHALEHLKKQGHIVGVATGRNQVQFSKVLDAKNFDFVVYCNGGYLEIDGQKVHDIQFPQENKNELCDLFDSKGYHYAITTHHHLYSPHPQSENVQRVMKTFSVPTPEQKDDLRDLPVYHFGFYEGKNAVEDIEQLKERYVFHSLGDFGWDIVVPEINKGHMLEKVIDIYQMDMENVIAFGDGDNDKMMLEKAGIGVAMGEGTKEVKEKADYVTNAAHENGIYNAIKYLGYIE